VAGTLHSFISDLCLPLGLAGDCPGGDTEKEIWTNAPGRVVWNFGGVICVYPSTGKGFFTKAGSLRVKLDASNKCNCRYTKQSSGVND
jgi:hypothetical protein